jgi:SAM-dependent methyltransferase
MTEIIDANYLRGDQYRDSSNLKKRTSLHERFSTNPQGWFAWVASQLSPLFSELIHSEPEQRVGHSTRVLEIGCGPGLLWAAQGEHIAPGARVTLSDFSLGMVTQAGAALQGQARAYTYAVNDAMALPFADNSFDLLIANHMLYHVPDRPRAFGEFWRVLKHGGRLVTATNGQGHLRELHAWIAQAAGCPAEKLDTMIWGQTLGFNLENGAEQLGAFFHNIQLSQYPDALEVTEVEPLLAYCDSMFIRAAEANSGALLERLRELWSEEIRTQQSVHIAKASGLFLARK